MPDSTGYTRRYEAPPRAIYYLRPSEVGVSDQRWIIDVAEALHLEQTCPERLIRVE